MKKQDSAQTKARFAEMVRRRLIGAGEKRPITYDQQEFALVVGNNTFYLGNVYRFCQGAGEDALQTFIRSWFSQYRVIPESFQDATPDLLPKLESRALLELCRLENHEVPPHHVVAEHLALTVAFDWPESIMWVTTEQLAHWGINFATALNAAQQNLVNGSKDAFRSSQPGLHVAAKGDYYDSTRLILTDQISRLPVEGDPVALVSDRDTLLVTGTNDGQGLAMMIDTARQRASVPYRHVPHLFRLCAGEWAPWLPASSHPQYEPAKHLVAGYNASVYEQQQNLLQAKYMDDGYFIVSCGTGGGTTYCWLSRLVPAILPQADVIGFANTETEKIAVEWKRVMEVMGDAWEPMDLYPTYYLVREFPLTEQWERLKQFA